MTTKYRTDVMEHYVVLFLFVFLLLSKVYLMPEYHWRILICKFLPSSAYAITYFLTICSLFESKRFLLIPIINTCSHLFCYYLQHMFLAPFNNALGQNEQIKNLSFNAFPGYCLLFKFEAYEFLVDCQSNSSLLVAKP